MKRLAHLRRALAEKNIEAFIALTQEDNNKNVGYLTGFSGSTGAVLVAQHDVLLGVDSRYRVRARKEARGCRVVDVVSFSNTAECIAALLEKVRGPKVRGIGYEGERIPVLMAKAWGKRFGTLVPTSHLVERLRQYKDPEEIQHLRSAARATSQAFAEIARNIHPGMSENDIARDIDHTLRRYGAVMPSFPTIVASGPNAAIPHHGTSARKVRAGESVIMDFGGMFDSGYCSDLTRTIFVPGKSPDAELVRVYNVVLGANRAALRHVKSGMTFKEYDALARDHIAQCGYGPYFTHSLGHSLGLEAHDPFAYKEDPIGNGVVFTNEPGIYIEGKGGVRIEDDLVMTATGAKRLTTAPYLDL